MTVEELIDLLSDYPEDAEVRLMVQSNWPFEHTLAGVVAKSEIHDPEEDEDDADDDEVEEEIVYLLEGTQLGYGSSAAWANAQR